MVDKSLKKTPSTQLGYHTNMVVVVKQTCIRQRPDIFKLFFKDKKVPIIYSALVYHCKRTMTTYLLMTRNVIYITSIKNNIIPPFIMRESGILVNDVARIYCR